MSETRTVDVVVIGAGLAGMSAAVRLTQLGVKPVVLEAGAAQSYLCASRYTGGLFHIAMDDALAPAEVARANLDKATSGTTAPELADALVANTRRGMDWLKALGVRFISAGPEGFRRNALSPPGMRQTGTTGTNGQPYWVGRSGDSLLRTLEAKLADGGGQLLRGVRARQLCMDAGRCNGVQATQGDTALEFHAKAVVIADGGFQANAQLLERFITKRPGQLLQRNARSGHGDGLLMAEAAGAKLVGMDRFYGHMCYRDAITDERFWPYPIVDSLCAAGIVVDETGRRFCDEGRGGVYITNEIARLPEPGKTAVIFDSAIWAGPGRDWILPPNPYLVSAGGKLVTAASIEELAGMLGLVPAALAETVANYNASLSGPSQLSPPRTTGAGKPWPIVQAPFHALPIAAGITYTMGGIATDANAQVLDASDGAITGLYAAGACTGGLEGGGFAGYSGGLTKSNVFGLLAGEAIARTHFSQGSS